MSLDDLVAQVDIERAPPSEHVVEMARFLEQRKGNVRDAFRTYANQAEAHARGGASEDIFGYEAPGARESRSIFAKAALAPRHAMSPQQSLRQLLDAKQQSLFEEEISTEGRPTRPTVHDEKYRKLKGKKRDAALKADLAKWEGGTLTNLPQGSEYAPSGVEGAQGDVFQEQEDIFGLAPQESSSGMPARRSPFAESWGERKTVSAWPPSSQPRSGPPQVSVRSSPESRSLTQRPNSEGKRSVVPWRGVR